MRWHRRLWVVGLLALTLGCWWLATADQSVAQGKGGGVTIPDEDFKLLVESSNKVIQQALAGKPDKRAAAKAQTAAIYIALYSQADKAKANERAGVGGAALQVAEQIKAGKFDDAKKLAAQLPTMKGGAAKPEAVALGKQIELDEVMMHFHRDKLGGTDVEFKLLNLSNDRASKKDKALSDKLMNDDLLVIAYQTAIVTNFVKDHDPGKSKKDWTKYAEEASANAMDLASAVKKKDGKQAWTALNKLNGSCTDCHNKFK